MFSGTYLLRSSAAAESVDKKSRANHLYLFALMWEQIVTPSVECNYKIRFLKWRKSAYILLPSLCAGADLKAECDYENDTNFERYLPKRKQRTPRFGVAFTVLAPLEDCRSKITCFE